MTISTSNHRRRSLKAAAALTLLIACTFAAGCGSRDNAPRAAGPATQGPNAVLTPEQEAAKQHAMQTGASLDAAREAAARKAAGGQ